MLVSLDDGTVPPIKYQYAELSKLYAVVSQLVRCCDVSEGCHSSYSVSSSFVSALLCFIDCVFTWTGRVRNEEIRKMTGLQKLELDIKARRLRWLGHVLRMEDSRIPRQAIQWELRGYKRKPGTLRGKKPKNW